MGMASGVDMGTLLQSTPVTKGHCGDSLVWTSWTSSVSRHPRCRTEQKWHLTSSSNGLPVPTYTNPSAASNSGGVAAALGYSLVEGSLWALLNLNTLFDTIFFHENALYVC